MSQRIILGRVTNVRATKRCDRCALKLEHVRVDYRTESGPGHFWLADPHTAPCGHECVAGSSHHACRPQPN